MSEDVEDYLIAREAAARAAAHADACAEEKGWERYGGLWDDEASDHLYEEKETLGQVRYQLACELLKERVSDAKRR